MAMKGNDSRLEELLLRWELGRTEGSPPRLEDLCSAAPELLNPLRQIVAEIGHLDDLLGTSNGGQAATPTAGRSPADGPPQPVSAVTTQAAYTNIRFHARGGLGEVVLAHDESLHREVAIKLIQPRLAADTDSVQRFLMEAEVTGKLEHPGVVPVLGVGRTNDGRPCYAMRFIRGQTLKQAIDQFHRGEPWSAEGSAGRPSGGRKPCPMPGSSDRPVPTESPAPSAHAQPRQAFSSLAFRQLLQRFIAVCNTLAYAHSRGILHRDLKPENIMLGGYGETLVVDWGLAKTFDRDDQARASGEETLEPNYAAATGDATQMGRARGTPAYMSPEQASGLWDLVGPASDIYGLGATLYEILAGQPPIAGKGRDEVLFRAQRGDFPPPRQVRSDVPRPLEAICLRAMKLDRQERYASAQALARDVENWLADEPVSAYAETLLHRLARWSRRHRAAAGTLAASILLLTFWFMVTFFLYRSYQERQTAEEQRAFGELLQAVQSDERLGLADLRAGDFARAERTFRVALERLADKENVLEPRRRLTGLRDQALRLKEYYRLSEEAERLGFIEYDDEATAACELALRQLGVLDHDEWWKNLPGADLTDEQREQLREDAFRHLVLLCAFHTKRAAVNFGTPEARESCHKALQTAERVVRFRDCQCIRLTEVFCHFSLGQIGQLRMRPVPSRPSCAADYYFMGMGHFWLWKFNDDQLARWVQRLSLFLPGLGLDSASLQQKAERYFRMAAALEPKRVYNYVWLGFYFREADQPEDAELCADACISLRPDLGLPYAMRAVTLMEQARAITDPAARDHLLGRCLADLEQADRLAAHEAEIQLIRANVFGRLGRNDQALEAHARLLEQDRPLEAVRQLRNFDAVQFRLEETRKYAELRTQAEPTNPRAWALLAHGNLSLARFSAALDAAEKALTFNPRETRALAVRGTVLARNGRQAEALGDFTAVLASQPGNYLALLGLSRVHEQSGRLDDALAAFDRLLETATTNWQRLQGFLGRARVLSRQGKSREAQAALDAARRINPVAARNQENAMAAGPLP